MSELVCSQFTCSCNLHTLADKDGESEHGMEGVKEEEQEEQEQPEEVEELCSKVSSIIGRLCA
eukprot:scaffold15090_cov22-Tisochrysis_lutea.AAC.1